MNKIILLSLFTCAILFSSNNYTFSKYSSSDSTVSDSKEVCIVSGETIGDGGVKYAYLNKEMTFCCGGCVKSFKKNPAKYLGDSGLWCPVCDEGDAKAELTNVSDGVSYYFCSEGCKEKFSADPDSYLNNYKK